MPDPRLGFQSLTDERQVSLEVEGDLPGWLGGTLVRTGPAKFEVGERSLNHWFDGLAMLHAFRFGEGAVQYANRFLRSRVYEQATSEGTLPGTEFATDPCRSIFGRVMSLFQPPKSTDNANVNVGRWADRMVAMTETPLPVAFDPETLETEGVVPEAVQLEGQITTAHPHTDPATGTQYRYVTELGPTSTYHLYAHPPGVAAPEEIGAISVDRPAYMHSFAMTERYLILAEFPLVVNPVRMLLFSKPFIEYYRWKPDRGTRFRIIDKQTGEAVAAPTTEAFFAFHHVNAFERDGAVVLDVIAYPDASVIDDLYLEALRSEARQNDGTGRLRRYTLPLDGSAPSMKPITDTPLELPRIHNAHNGRSYTTVYGTGSHPDGTFHDQLVKVRVPEGEETTWREPDVYPGEPVFVPHPDGGAEDDGVILSVLLDAAAETSALLVLDAATFTERARAPVPHAIPFGFHGAYGEF